MKRTNLVLREDLLGEATRLSGEEVALFLVPSAGLDSDADLFFDECDNCPTLANTTQANADNDLFGDACDLCPADSDNDSDADGRCAGIDNCPGLANPNQADSDGLPARIEPNSKRCRRTGCKLDV